MKTQKLVLESHGGLLFPFLPRERKDHNLFFRVGASKAHRWIKARNAFLKAQEELIETFSWEDMTK